MLPAVVARLGASELELVAAIDLCQAEDDLGVAEGCSRQRYEHEAPEREVFVPAFLLDRFEVTQAQYAQCMAAHRCDPPEPSGDERLTGRSYPVVFVDAERAARFCVWRGGRLPREDEWERAARGSSARRFPWGRQLHSAFANHGRVAMRPDERDGHFWLAPVGALAGDRTPEGIFDLAGNVAEWTSSTPSDEEVGRDRAGGDATVRAVVRGGSWAHPTTELRGSHRTWLPRTATYPDLGFRCAEDMPR
jgi:formylglycine-generating enzyme required for sulfatase activity